LRFSNQRNKVWLALSRPVFFARPFARTYGQQFSGKGIKGSHRPCLDASPTYARSNTTHNTTQHKDPLITQDPFASNTTTTTKKRSVLALVAPATAFTTIAAGPFSLLPLNTGILPVVSELLPAPEPVPEPVPVLASTSHADPMPTEDEVIPGFNAPRPRASSSLSAVPFIKYVVTDDVAPATNSGPAAVSVEARQGPDFVNEPEGETSTDFATPQDAAG
jgi:hypothetical protein